MSTLNTEVQIANLVSKIFPDVAVRKTDYDYVFSINGFYHSSQPLNLIENTCKSESDMRILAESIAIDLFKMKIESELRA